MIVKRQNPFVGDIKKSQLELYKFLKHRHETNTQFKKEELIEIYSRFVMPKKRGWDKVRLTEEQIYNNASGWLDRAISTLVRKGYLGLTFEKEIGEEFEWQE